MRIGHAFSSEREPLTSAIHRSPGAAARPFRRIPARFADSMKQVTAMRDFGHNQTK